MRAPILLVMLATVAGCATRTTTTTEVPSEVPMAQQTPQAEGRARAKIHADLGMLYFGNRQVGTAIEEARAAVEADPGYALAYNLQGLIHSYLNEPQQARQNFEKALRLAPQDPQINNDYGLFLCQQGEERQAIRMFMTAVKNPLYTTPTKPYTNAGLCALRLGDDAAAADYFNKAFLEDGRNGQAAFHLADINFRRGNPYQARKHLGELHRIMEPNAASLWLALRIERRLGNREEEASLGAQLRRKFAGTPEYQALMQGRYD